MSSTNSHFGQFLPIIAAFHTVSDGVVDDVEASLFNPTLTWYKQILVL